MKEGACCISTNWEGIPLLYCRRVLYGKGEQRFSNIGPLAALLSVGIGPVTDCKPSMASRSL